MLKKEIPLLYVLKAVCALLIVFIHLPSAFGLAIVLQPLMRIGVPVFFMISGYFLASSSGLSIVNIKRQLWKILCLILQVYTVYIGFMIFRNLFQGYPLINPHWLTWDFIIRLLLVGDNVDSVLWYLTAYAESLLVLWISLKIIGERKTRYLGIILIIPLLLLAILFNRYSEFVLGRIFDIAISRNAITVALPCLMLGAMVRIRYGRLPSLFKIRPLIIILFILAYVEYALLYLMEIDGSGADFNMFTFPLAFAVFLYCVLRSTQLLPSNKIILTLAYIGKNNSADIYLYHSLVWQIFSLLLFPLISTSRPYIANAEFIILVVLILSIVKNKLLHKNGFQAN